MRSASGQARAMDDRRSQFLILFGDLCRAAGLAGFAVTVHLDDGTTRSGVPAVAAAYGPDAVDDTGLAAHVTVGLSTVDLRSVRACSVRSPE